MTTLKFDSLRYVRRLMDGGVSEAQAEAHAEAMAEVFGYVVDDLVTKDYLDARLAEQDARINARFAEQDARIDARFSETEKHFQEQLAVVRVTQGKHSVVLAATFVAVVIPLVKQLLA